MLGHSLPIKSGQKVLLEGRVVQNYGFSGDIVKATVLAEGLLPEPGRTSGRLNDVAARQPPRRTGKETTTAKKRHTAHAPTPKRPRPARLPPPRGSVVRIRGVFD